VLVDFYNDCFSFSIVYYLWFIPINHFFKLHNKETYLLTFVIQMLVSVLATNIITLLLLLSFLDKFCRKVIISTTRGNRFRLNDCSQNHNNFISWEPSITLQKVCKRHSYYMV